VITIAEEIPIEEMVKKAQLGDQGAAEWLYIRFLPFVLKICRNIKAGYPDLRDNLEEEDLAQEIFMRLLAKGKIGQYNFSVPFISWLTTVAINQCRDYLSRMRARGLSRHQSIESILNEAPPAGRYGKGRKSPPYFYGRRWVLRALSTKDSPLEKLEEQQSLSASRLLLKKSAELVRQKLSPQAWYILWTRLRDTPYKEIAAELGITEMGVRTSFFRSRHLLKHIVETLSAQSEPVRKVSTKCPPALTRRALFFSLKPHKMIKHYSRRHADIQGLFPAEHRDFENPVGEFQNRRRQTADFVAEYERNL